MTTHVSCPTCLRREVWDGDTKRVEQEGGSRKPAVNPNLAAWDTLRVAVLAGRHPRAVCICGQPLIDAGHADASHPAIPWVLTLADGTEITVAQGFTGPNGALSIAEVTDQLEAGYPRKHRETPGMLAFQIFTVGPVVASIFTLWLMAASVLLMMLRALGTPMGP